jgi:hypothetical protein
MTLVHVPLVLALVRTTRSCLSFTPKLTPGKFGAPAALAGQDSRQQGSVAALSGTLANGMLVCQYTYSLPTGSLAAGPYEIMISFTDGTPTPLQKGCYSKNLHKPRRQPSPATV